MRNLEDDFKDFMSGDVQPPIDLSQKILAMVREDLNPPGALIFTKLLGIHFIVSLFTLSLCPQFGLRIFGNGAGLMQYFMRFGESGCMAACGVIFLGSTSFVTASVMNNSEGRKLLQWWPVHALLLVGFSLSFFFSVDAFFTLDSVLWWTLGSFIGGYIFFRGALSLKRFLILHRVV